MVFILFSLIQKLRTLANLLDMSVSASSSESSDKSMLFYGTLENSSLLGRVISISSLTEDGKRKSLSFLVIIFAILSCIILLAILLVVRSPSFGNQDATFPPTVILISIDGFRPDYLYRYGDYSPNLIFLSNTGVLAEHLIPCFPTKTFPNHYTIVTGLYPESHGIVANRFYDPIFNETFNAFGPDSTEGKWWNGEPIWVTNQLQKHKSATCFWPGSEALIDNLRPTYWLAYNESMPYGERVSQILSWLDLPKEQRPNFLALYFEIVDSYGHAYGPYSPLLGKAIQIVDEAIGELIFGLRNRSLFGQVDLIICSDHGMAQISENRTIFVDQHVNMEELTVVDYSPVLQVIPMKGKEAAVFNALNNTHPNLTAYMKEAILDRWFYNDSQRIAPIIAVADDGWVIITNTTAFNQSKSSYNGGDHGYDNILPSMQAFFIGNGPHFKNSYISPPFSNLHLYSLMCYILGLQPAPNNGTIDAIMEILI